MDITNHTPYQAAYNTGLMPSGRYCLIVVIKATYDFPTGPNSTPQRAEEQIELYEADAFTGEPGYSSPLYENDFATHKPKCDLILQQAVAYAPDGEPAKQVEVALGINKYRKAFRVLGKRVWEKIGPFSYPTEPEPFTEMPLNWEMAYGGVDETAYPEEELSDAFLYNPIGTGYWRKPTAKKVNQTAMPQTEALEDPIKNVNEPYTPQGFGPVGRNWLPRSQYGGTYDEAWAKNDKPFYPQDFNELYHQCAPEDQQIKYPQGGEIITLHNLTPEGVLRITLPALEEPVMVELSNGDQLSLETMIDTITLDMQAQKLTLVARAQYPLKNTIHEVAEFVVGSPPPEPESEDEEDEEDWEDDTDEPNAEDSRHA